jgi:hypothetical protein
VWKCAKPATHVQGQPGVAVPVLRGHEANLHQSSTISSASILDTYYNVLSRAFFLFSSIQRKNGPRCNEWRVPTAEVRFFTLFLLISFMSKPGPRTTVHIQHRSTSLTITHFSTSFISIGHFFWVKTRMTISVSTGEDNGLGNTGGIGSRTFVKDGGTSFLGRHPTWVSALFVHMARLWQTCWHTHHPFHSSSITIA